MQAPSFQIDLVARALIAGDAVQRFAEKCEAIHKDMVLLLDKTTLPDNATSTDSRVAGAIRALDNMFKSPENNVVLRLDYVQLARMLGVLKDKIKHDRAQGRVVGKRSRCDATVAIDLYLSATGRTDREEIRELTRLGNRWAILAGGYSLLLTTFTDVAVQVMYVLSLPFLSTSFHLLQKTANLVCETVIL